MEDFIGLEMAEAFHKRGVKMRIVEKTPNGFSNVKNITGGALSLEILDPRKKNNDLTVKSQFL